MLLTLTVELPEGKKTLIKNNIFFENMLLLLEKLKFEI